MSRYDIAIAGGGPAGSTTAILLRRAGARVALIDAGVTRSRLEGLSPRVMQILDSLALSPAAAGPVQRSADWGALTGSPNAEFLVDRAEFDRGLRAQARAAGVDVRIDRVDRLDAAAGRIALASGETLAANLLVEARGRRAPAGDARRRGPDAIAIAGWSGVTSAPMAAIAAKPEGWVWQAASGPGPCWTQILVDATAVSGGTAGLRAAWDAVLDTAACPLPENPVVRAAELRLLAPDLEGRVLRIGDAAVAMDPLSGHGVFWALSSALSAMPILRALQDGACDLAARFYRERVAETFWRQARIGRDFYRLAGQTGRFWQRRCAWPDGAPAHPIVTAPHLRRQVVVREGRLVEADALVTAQDPTGVAFLHGQEIAPILKRLVDQPWPDRQGFCQRIMPELPEAVSGAIHDWFLDRGLARSVPNTPIKQLESV